MGLLAGALTGASGAAGLVAAHDAAREAAAASHRAVALENASAHATRARVQGRELLVTSPPSTSGGSSASAATRRVAEEVAAAESDLVGAATTDPDVAAAAAALGRYPGVVAAAAGPQDDTVRATEAAFGTLPASAAAARQAADTASAGGRVALGVTGAALGTLALGGAAFWLARRTRRAINPPLTAAVLLGALVTFGTAAAGGAATQAASAAEQAGAASTPRTLALDAARLRADQLTALSSGSTGSTGPGGSGGSGTTDAHTHYEAVQRELDALPSSDPAAAPGRDFLAASSRTPGSSAADRDAAEKAGAPYDRLQGALDTRLGPTAATAVPPAGAMPWLLLLGGVGAGGLAAAGAARALREYR